MILLLNSPDPHSVQPYRIFFDRHYPDLMPLGCLGTLLPPLIRRHPVDVYHLPTRSQQSYPLTSQDMDSISNKAVRLQTNWQTLLYELIWSLHTTQPVPGDLLIILPDLHTLKTCWMAMEGDDRFQGVMAGRGSKQRRKGQTPFLQIIPIHEQLLEDPLPNCDHTTQEHIAHLLQLHQHTHQSLTTRRILLITHSFVEQWIPYPLSSGLPPPPPLRRSQVGGESRVEGTTATAATTSSHASYPNLFHSITTVIDPGFTEQGPITASIARLRTALASYGPHVGQCYRLYTEQDHHTMKELDGRMDQKKNHTEQKHDLHTLLLHMGIHDPPSYPILS